MRKVLNMEVAKFPKRATAYKFWIRDILNAKPLEREGIRLFDVRGKETSRVNVMATIVDGHINEAKTFASITLDDGTDTISVKAWKEDLGIFDSVNVGDSIMAIGKVRIYNNEVFLIPEILKKHDIDWLLFRKKELETLFGKPSEKVEQVVQENKVEEVVDNSGITEEEVVNEPTETARQKVLGLIERNNSQEGAEISNIVQSSGLAEDAAEKVIDELLKEGEVFQPRTGFLKVI